MAFEESIKRMLILERKLKDQLNKMKYPVWVISKIDLYSVMGMPCDILREFLPFVIEARNEEEREKMLEKKKSKRILNSFSEN